jgi:hypothetical protein
LIDKPEYLKLRVFTFNFTASLRLCLGIEEPIAMRRNTVLYAALFHLEANAISIDSPVASPAQMAVSLRACARRARTE